MAERVAATYGLEVFDLQFRREAPGWVLRVIIDRPAAAAAARPGAPGESVGVDDCRRVSEDLGTLLDVEDAIEGAYTLEVSSPGLDRPLRGPADNDRVRGRLALFVAAEAVNGQTHFRGRIQGLEEDCVVLVEGSRTHRIPVALVSRARLEVEF